MVGPPILTISSLCFIHSEADGGFSVDLIRSQASPTGNSKSQVGILEDKGAIMMIMMIMMTFLKSL